jgi:hypothetical protein
VIPAAPDVMIDTIRVIDDIFIQMVETDLGRQHLPIDDAVEEMWTALESGDLRLVVDGGRLHVEPFEGRRPGRPRGARRARQYRPSTERTCLARQHRPIVEARWRVLDEANLA